MKGSEFWIGRVPVGKNHPPVVLAEMSGNHNQSLDRALDIVEAAAKAGAHGVKLQTYTADTMTLPIRTGEFVITDPKSLWYGKALYDLYEEAHTPWEWHHPIKEKCESLGMFFMSTPFDESAVDFLESLNVPAYKVASFECTDLPLIRKIAATRKPMIISTGMASVGEIEETVKVAREAGCKDLLLLKCTSSYPASPKSSNVRTIPHLADLFDVQVGLSDHTMGCGAAIAAVALGATFVEKHFTIRRLDGGVDSIFSLEPEEFKVLVIETQRAWESLGYVKYGAGFEDESSKIFRRSLYISKPMKKGEFLSEKNIRRVRPGLGLPPKEWGHIVGRRITRDAQEGTPLTWDLIG